MIPKEFKNIFKAAFNTKNRDPQTAVAVASADWPNFPGAVVYQIVGYSAEIVQREITRLFNQTENHKGMSAAEFDNPKRLPNGDYYSQGYTYIRKT